MKMTKQGSFTIEASFIMPLVIFVIITLVYIGFYLHDMTYLQGLANEGALKGAKALTYPERDLEIGRIEYSSMLDRFLYWRFMNHHNTEYLESYIKNQIGQNVFQVNTQKTHVETEVEKNLLHTYVKVSIRAPFETPFRFVPMLMNRGEGLYIQVHSKAQMPDASEFIRNIQLMDQMAEEITILQKPKQKYEEIMLELENMLKK
jgi:hypothetical protein